MSASSDLAVRRERLDELLGHELVADLELEAIDGHARALERLVELGLVLEAGLELVDLLLDVGVGDLDALVLGGLLDELLVDDVVEETLLEVEQPSLAVCAGEHVRVLLLELLELLVERFRRDGLAVDLGHNVLVRAAGDAESPDEKRATERGNEQVSSGLHRPYPPV